MHSGMQFFLQLFFSNFELILSLERTVQISVKCYLTSQDTITKRDLPND